MMSYVAVGARSVENQFHRLVASGCDVPVGMKNPTSGDLTVMLNSVVAAQLPHDFIFRGWEVQCPGNPLTHTILRGAVNKHGASASPTTTTRICSCSLNLYGKRICKNPACHRGYQPLPTPTSSTRSRSVSPRKCCTAAVWTPDDIKQLVKGLMIESYIEPGSQKIGEHVLRQVHHRPLSGMGRFSERLLYEIADTLD